MRFEPWMTPVVDAVVKGELRRYGYGWDEDAYQDGWHKALEMIGRYRPIPGDRGKLLHRYLCMGVGMHMHRRRCHRAEPFCYYRKTRSVTFQYDPDRDDRVCDPEPWRKIFLGEILRRIQAEQRTALEMVLQGMTHAEIGEVMGRSTENASSLIFRAKTKATEEAA